LTAPVTAPGLHLASSLSSMPRVAGGWRAIFGSALTAAAFFTSPTTASAYSALAHEAIIDAAWDGSIEPALRARFHPTPDELKRAVDQAMDSGRPTIVNAVIDPSAGTESRKRSTHAPEKGEGGVDWGDVAREGARFTRSGTFNTILRGILRGLGGKR